MGNPIAKVKPSIRKSHRLKEKHPEEARDRGGNGTDEECPTKEERTMNRIEETKSRHKTRESHKHSIDRRP